MCVICVEIISFICVGNAKRIHLVWPYFKAVYEHLLNSAEGLDLDVSVVLDETTKSDDDAATVPEMSMQRQNSPYFSRRRVSSAGSTEDGNHTNSSEDQVHYVEEAALFHATKCLIRTCTTVMRKLCKSGCNINNMKEMDWIVSAFELINTLPEKTICKSSRLILNGVMDMFQTQGKTMCSNVWSAEMSVLARLATFEKSTRSKIWNMMEWILVNDRLNKCNVDAIVKIADEMGALVLYVGDTFDGTEARFRHIQFLQTMLQTLAKLHETCAKKCDLVWLNVMQSFKSFLLSDNDKIRRRASSCLHTALLAPNWIVNASTWKSCFENVLFPLAHEVHETGTDSMRVRTATLLARTCLHNISSFAEHPAFHKLWFRIIGVLAKDMQGGSEVLAEAVLEAFKNVMVVMISTGTFDRVSRKSGQDVLTMTWAFIATLSPTLRGEIEAMLGGSVDMSSTTSRSEKEEKEDEEEEKSSSVVTGNYEYEEEQGSGAAVMSL
jgi:hypothetical protein